MSPRLILEGIERIAKAIRFPVFAPDTRCSHMPNPWNFNDSEGFLLFAGTRLTELSEK
jgi:hypothetical protein